MLARWKAFVVSLLGAAGGACGGRHDPVAELVARLAEERVWCLDGDDVVAPEALPQLVALGAAAVPALLAATAGEDDWIRLRAVDALGRIGEARALPTLEALFVRDDFELRCRIVEALVRIGGEPAIAAVRRVVASLPEQGSQGVFDQDAACELMWRLRERGGVPVLLDLAENETWSAVEWLAMVESVREALGMGALPQGGWQWAFDPDLFVPAVREWYSEQVLGEPSPWRPRADFVFSEPFASEKQRAIAALRRELVATDGVTMRLLPRDVPGDGGEPPASGLSLLARGIGRGVEIDWWYAAGDGVVWCQIVAAPSAEPRSASGVMWQCACKRVALTRAELQGWWAGVRAVRAARVLRWWKGPDGLGWEAEPVVVSSHDARRRMSNREVFVVQRLGDAAVAGFSGQPDIYDLERLVPLLTAVALRPAAVSEAPASTTDEVRQEFREHVLTLPAFWPYGTAWDWARPRLVGVAGVFGDARLLPMLAEFLNYPDQPENGPTRAAVCDALAALTGVDLRLDADGEPRSPDALVQAWRDWLQKR